jgi:cytoskeletal protein CcmA (bactofilin family)
MLTEIPSFTVVAEGSRTQGSISFCSQCIILGLIEGNVFQHSHETLTLGKSGWIRGDITSQGAVSISGRVEGNIFSTTKITILETAIITGTLICPSIEIRPGAVLESDILMHWSPSQQSHKPIAA